MRFKANPLALRTGLLILAMALAAACGSATKNADGTPRVRRNPSVMDSTELRGGGFNTVFDAISALRADWLLPRGGPSGGRAPELGVWLEGQQRSQGVAYLRNIRPIDIKQVRRLSTTESLHTYNWPWGGLVITPR